VASPDSELLPAARRHAPDAWDTLLKRHQLPLYTYVAEILHDETAALDTVQETFTAAVRNIASLRDDAKFAAWLFGIAQQKCLQHLRRVRRDDALFVTDDDHPTAECPDPNQSPTTPGRAPHLSFWTSEWVAKLRRRRRGALQ
jgi:RNA polymerase sigma factor (sigma-70 family)